MSDPLSPNPARRDGLILASAMLGFAVVFVAFWPRLPGIMDEVGFINQAVMWSRGGLSAESTNMTLANGWAVSHGLHVPLRHPGFSALLLPIVALTDNVRAVFIVGLIVHLLMTAIAAKLFAHWKISPLWALLVLFHPTLILFSRTALADGAAATGVLLAYFAAVRMKRPYLVMGLALGFATACRMQIGTIAFGAGLWVLLRRDLRGVILFGLGAAIFGLPLAAYNYKLFGSPMGYSFGEGFISVQHVRQQLPGDLLLLSIIWPLMLPIAALNRRLPHKLLWWLMLLPFMGLMACYHHRDSTPSMLQTAFIWPRLLQPVIPLLIASYAHALATSTWPAPVWARLARPAFAVVVALAGLAATSAVFRQHQQRLNEFAAVKTAICANLPAGSRVIFNGNAGKLVGILDRECGGYQGIIIDDLTPDDAVDVYFKNDLAGIAWYTKAGASDLPAAVANDLPKSGFVRVPSVPGLELWKKARP